MCIIRHWSIVWELVRFKKYLASEIIRMTYVHIHGVTVDIEKSFTLIMCIMKHLAIHNQISLNTVTTEIIHEARANIPTRDSIAVLNFEGGNKKKETRNEQLIFFKESTNNWKKYGQFWIYMVIYTY